MSNKRWTSIRINREALAYMGRRFSDVREEFGVRRERLAEDIDISPTSVYRWEKGGDMKLSSFIWFCGGLGIDPGELLNEALEAHPEPVESFLPKEPKEDV